MKKWESILVKACGVYLIYLALRWLVTVTSGLMGTLSFFDFLDIFQGSALSDSTTTLLKIGPLIYVSWGIFIFILTAIGVFKLKKWGRYLSLIIAIWLLSSLFLNHWLSLVEHSTAYYLGSITPSIFILILFNRRGIKETFDRGFRDLTTFHKTLITFFVIFVVLEFLSLPLFIGYMNIKHKDLIPLMRMEVENVEYKVTNKDFLKKNCEKQNIFGYSIYLPKEVQLLFFHTNLDSKTFEKIQSWDLFLVKRITKDSSLGISVDKTIGNSLASLAKALKFKSTYHFEKAIHNPSWSPFHLLLKRLLLPSNLKRTEEVALTNSKGLLEIAYLKDSDKWHFSISVYDLQNNNPLRFEFRFNTKLMSIDNFKNILASIQFEGNKPGEKTFFEKGKRALSGKNYLNAQLSFMNALNLNGKNPEYSFYLARSLYEETKKYPGFPHLTSIIDFLNYTLNLDPKHTQARNLLNLAKKDLEKRKEHNKGKL